MSNKPIPLDVYQKLRRIMSRHAVCFPNTPFIEHRYEIICLGSVGRGSDLDACFRDWTSRLDDEVLRQLGDAEFSDVTIAEASVYDRGKCG